MKLRSAGLIFTSVAAATAIFLVTLFCVRRNPQPADLRIVTYPSNSKMHVIKGDITTLKTTHGLEVDAIVNAANEQLNAGSGVCGAIFRAANDKRLQEECHAFKLTEKGIRCKAGEAVATGAYGLTSQGVKGIIHTPGPDCRIPEQNENRQQLLVSCYKNITTLAKKMGWRSIAIPSISTATYKCPIEEASETATNAVNEELTNSGNQIENVYFVCHDDRTYNRYTELWLCPKII